MPRAPGAERYVPPHADLDELRTAAAACRGCDLYRNATQVVFSSGPVDAPVVMIGEQPGDIEDRKGQPFVGPAGALLTRGMAEAGLDPDHTYLTNAVKHFKFRTDSRGKRRIHDKPGRTEIIACRPWLAAEFRVLRPRVIVALGATAAQALAGPAFRVTQTRGQVLGWPGVAENPSDFPVLDPPAAFLATVHPSAVLRAENRETAYSEFVADLAVVARVLDQAARR
jgi:uracil-DNA glycosylase